MTRANQALLVDIFRAAVRAAEPERLVGEALIERAGVPAIVRGKATIARIGGGLIWLVAAGKASGGMVRAALPVLRDRLAGGVVVAPGGTPVRPPLRSFVGGHPLPNRASAAAGRAVWRMLERVRGHDTILVLLSGGASSLLVLPASGIPLRDKIRTTDLLLRAGAGIAELNAVRKHLSRLKGGGLARRAGDARVICLLISDVVGGSPSVIGSGPAAPDRTTFADAWRVLRRYGLENAVPRSVRRRLERGRRGWIEDTLKPGGGHARHLVLGDVGTSLVAAAEWARSHGLEPRIWTTALRGDTHRAARRFAAEARRLARRGRAVCLLAGGETTVVVRGRGRGGRNQEFALVVAREIAGDENVLALSAGSDGIDGPTDAAGAFVDGFTVARAERLGLEVDRFLERNDAYSFFERLGDLFRPGPTGTNVMDLKIVVGSPRGRG